MPASFYLKGLFVKGKLDWLKTGLYLHGYQQTGLSMSEQSTLVPLFLAYHFCACPNPLECLQRIPKYFSQQQCCNAQRQDGLGGGQVLPKNLFHVLSSHCHAIESMLAWPGRFTRNDFCVQSIH